MPIFHAIVLGLVQGLSEFLPISSSGHLLLVPWLFGWNDFESADVEKAFDVALHLGTLIAAIFYFRKDLVVYVRDGLRLVFDRRRPPTPEGRLAWLLLLSTVPAALAGADAFVRELPEGYETIVGDGGRPLSAGQLQRIALARAFVRDAPLVILDEPTANLDPESAELVGAAVERLRQGRTLLLIAHRPELARRADRVVTLASGRIVEPAEEAA